VAWSRAHPEARKAIYHSRRAAEGSFTAEEWKSVIEAQAGRCLHCNTLTSLTVDHIVPLARGGTNWISNIQGLCRRCNSVKGAKLEEELERVS
jgi:5-methylcytosine-specific restriction endonuclease McrA